MRPPLRRSVAIGAVAVGRSHTARGTECEDAVHVVEGPVTVAAVADGAGTARHARRGADTVVRVVAALLRAELGSLLRGGPLHVREHVLGAVDEAIAAEADLLRATARDLASTLIFVAVGHGRFLAGHLGDGMIGARRAGRLEVLSQPVNGDHANETVFVPTRRGAGDLRLYTGPSANVDGFVLMTDGAMDGLWGVSRDQPSVRSPAPVIARWLDALEVATVADVEQALAESLLGPVRAVTRDDCGVALVRSVGLGRLGSARAYDLLGGGGRKAMRVRGRVARAWGGAEVDAPMAAIARRVGLSPSTVRRHVDKLRRLGWG